MSANGQVRKRHGTPAASGCASSRTLTGEPQDRDELVELLREASARGLIDADALPMLEGVLDVADIQVRDIMVPRSQMVVLRARRPARRACCRS